MPTSLNIEEWEDSEEEVKESKKIIVPNFTEEDVKKIEGLAKKDNLTERDYLMIVLHNQKKLSDKLNKLNAKNIYN